MKSYIYVLSIISILNIGKADFFDYGTIITGRPTDNSITLNILAKNTLIYYIEYGTSIGSYEYKTPTDTSVYPEPSVLKIENLSPDKTYYYRIQYKDKSANNFSASSEYFFSTQRGKGKKFSFTILSDTHLYDKKGSSGCMMATMQNMERDSADFIIDMGDTFGDDHNPTTITDEEVKKLHLNLLPYFGILCHSSPLYLCIGNHEGENGYYLLQTPPDNLATYETKWRTKYYPNPYPDGFYSGNDEIEPNGIGRPQNYFAYEWGDALFVILDVYRYYTANEKPQKWDWTIGEKQYFWLKNTLEQSKAKYKFVFAHHTHGQGRGAATTAMLYEWGGYDDAAKTKYTFDKNRPGWGKPIHQLMTDNGVQIFFQGHDHVFSKETVDGLVYQECPMGADSTYEIGYLANADAYTGIQLDGSGYLRVTVSSDESKVDYVKSYLTKDETDSLKNGMTGYSYTVKSKISDINETTGIKPEFELYPNPANDFIYIFNQIGNIEIYNIFGVKIRDGITGNNSKIDISLLDKGIYFVKNGNKIIKFVKI
jgi:hypothetical protein